jgi:hypothetical protein
VPASSGAACLAAAVRAEEAETHARTEHEVELGDDRSPAAFLPEAARDDQAPGLPSRRGEGDARLGRSHAILCRRELADELTRARDPRLLLGGARLGALTEPRDLAAHAVGEGLAVRRLLAEGVVTALEEIAVAADGLEEAARVDAVDLDHALGDGLEKPAVVADREIREALGAE